MRTKPRKKTETQILIPIVNYFILVIIALSIFLN